MDARKVDHHGDTDNNIMVFPNDIEEKKLKMQLNIFIFLWIKKDCVIVSPKTA